MLKLLLIILVTSATALHGRATAHIQGRISAIAESNRTVNVFSDGLMDLGLGDGFLEVSYKGANQRPVVQVSKDGQVYNYWLTCTGRDVLPLQMGEGEYRVSLLESEGGSQYKEVSKTSVWGIGGPAPFLHRNMHVWWDLSIYSIPYSGVQQAYVYVMGALEYDDEKAASVSVGYLPDIRGALEGGKGICSDYASLFAAILRANGVPVKYVVGNAGGEYHAWTEVLEDGEWKVYDPTFGDSGYDCKDYRPEKYY